MKFVLVILSLLFCFNTFAQGVTVADVSVNVSAMLNPSNDTLTLTATAYLPPNTFQCGDDDARETRLILSLPPESKIVSPRPAGCSIRKHSTTNDPSFIACYLGNMHAGTTGKTIDITIKTDYKGLTNVGPYGCSAFIISETPDCNRANNFDAIEIGVPTPRLTTSQSSKIYPNPATSSLQLEINAKEGPYTIDVLSTNGKLLSRQGFTATSEGLQSFTVDLNEIPEGIYFCSIYEANKLIDTQKINIIK